MSEQAEEWMDANRASSGFTVHASYVAASFAYLSQPTAQKSEHGVIMLSSLRVDKREEDHGGGRTIAGIIIAVVSGR